MTDKFFVLFVPHAEAVVDVMLDYVRAYIYCFATSMGRHTVHGKHPQLFFDPNRQCYNTTVKIPVNVSNESAYQEEGERLEEVLKNTAFNSSVQALSSVAQQETTR